MCYSPDAKKVLMISYFFPPLGGAGVQRVQKFVKYLPQFKIKPYVLTVKPVEYIAYDETLLDEIKLFTPIYRSESLDPMRILYFIEKFRKSKKRAYTNTSSSLKNLSRDIFPIDSKIGWLPFAIGKGVKLCKEKNIKVIYATLPPFSASLVAYFVSKITGIPYVLDYRDLWQGKPEITYLTNWHKKVSIYWEKKVLGSAIKVIINTGLSLKKIQSIYPEIEKGKFTVIHNGYDEADFNVDYKKDESKIIFTYTGGFYGERTPEYFVKALSNIKDKLPDNVEFHFVGNYDYETLQWLQKVPKRIKIIDQVTHLKSIQYLLESDFLMIFIAKRNSEIVIPAKLFEYLATAKPILAMVPTKGEVANIVNNEKVGLVCAPDDINKIEKNILELIKNREQFVIKKDAFGRFSRKNLTLKLSELLNEI